MSFPMTNPFFSDVGFSVDSSTELTDGSWAPAASKSGGGDWTGTSTVTNGSSNDALIQVVVDTQLEGNSVFLRTTSSVE